MTALERETRRMVIADVLWKNRYRLANFDPASDSRAMHDHVAAEIGEALDEAARLIESNAAEMWRLWIGEAHDAALEAQSP